MYHLVKYMLPDSQLRLRIAQNKLLHPPYICGRRLFRCREEPATRRRESVTTNKNLLHPDLSSHDAVAAVEVVGVHVHGAAFSPHTATLPTGQLGQNAQDRHTHNMGETVGPGGDSQGVSKEGSFCQRPAATGCS